MVIFWDFFCVPKIIHFQYHLLITRLKNVSIFFFLGGGGNLPPSPPREVPTEVCCGTESRFLRHPGIQDGRKIWRKSRKIWIKSRYWMRKFIKSQNIVLILLRNIKWSLVFNFLSMLPKYLSLNAYTLNKRPWKSRKIIFCIWVHTYIYTLNLCLEVSNEFFPWYQSAFLGDH